MLVDIVKAIDNGDLEAIKIFIKYGFYTWSENDTMYTAKNLQILKYAHENGCPWDEGTVYYAAKIGNLDSLKYAIENNCDWDQEYTIKYASSNGHLECLKYLHKINCSWTEKTTAATAENGQLECLKYLHENGCPWDIYTTILILLRFYVKCELLFFLKLVFLTHKIIFVISLKI